MNAIGGGMQPLLGGMSWAMRPFKPKPGTVKLPQGVKPEEETSVAQLQSLIESLGSKRKQWANLDNQEKARLFKKCLDTTYKATEEGAQLLVDAKGSYGQGRGEERCLLITTLIALREYADTLQAQGKQPPAKLYQRKDGQFVAQVFPTGLDALFFGGYRGEVWIQPGKEPTQGHSFNEAAPGTLKEGSIALVLGAGNQISVALTDILHMLVTENSVVICKMNPILDFLKPFVEKAFAPLIEAGYVAFAYGGLEQGQFLTEHQQIAKIHLTGSAATYDAVVWGKKDKTGQPRLQKQVTAELGCVTPYIITPGDWSQQAIDYYADEIAAGLVTNAGHNCCKLEILVTAKDWPQREQLIQAIRKALNAIPRKVAWYPNSASKHATFRQKFPGAEELGAKIDTPNPPEGYLPWLFKSGLAPAEADSATENWCGVLQEVAIPDTGSDPARFLEAAVDYANNKCWGSLSCTLIAPPQTDAAALDKAVAGLKYGAIGVNIPSFSVFSFTKMSWGAFPGNTPQNVESGIGAVHNTSLFDHPQKSVLFSPWIHHPKHLWSPTVKNLDTSSYYAAKFQAHQDLLSMTATAMSVLRG